MNFLSICPRSQKYLEYNLPYIPLRVVKGDVDFKPDFSTDITDLNGGYKHFKVNNGKADSFDISVVIFRDDKLQFSLKDVANLIDDTGNDIIISGDEDFQNVDPSLPSSNGYAKDLDLIIDEVTVGKLLNYWMRTGTPLMLQSRAVNIVTGNTLWLITKNSKRKQEYENLSIWDLTFTKYDPFKYSIFTTHTQAVQNALGKAKTTTSTGKKTTVKKKTTARDQLKKCKLSQLKYSKTKKVVPCVKYMQVVLYGFGFLKKNQVDGWYGNVTLNAVKKFQKKFHLTWKVAVTGHVDKATFIALNYADVSSSVVRTATVRNGQLVMG